MLRFKYFHLSFLLRWLSPTVVNGASRPTSRLDQVTFNDTSGSGDASAVQLDQYSSYKAEGTDFIGFVGEVYTRQKAKLLHSFGRRELTARCLLEKAIDLMDKSFGGTS